MGQPIRRGTRIMKEEIDVDKLIEEVQSEPPIYLSPDCDAESCSANHPETPSPDGLPHSAERSGRMIAIDYDRIMKQLAAISDDELISYAMKMSEWFITDEERAPVAAVITTLVDKFGNARAVATSEARGGRRND